MKKYPRLTPPQQKELKDIVRKKNGSMREIRKAQAILLLDQNVSEEIIEATTGYSRRRIYFCQQTYHREGWEGLKDRRKKAVRRLLNQKQRQEIITLLSREKPTDYGYESDYWTTAILADLVQARYEVRYRSKTSYYLLFQESRLSFHKPGKVYEKRDEEKVTHWKEEVQPQLQQALQEAETIVLAEDEMVLSSQTTFQKIWLPQGEYPKIEVSNTKTHRSIYGFLNLKTGQAHVYKKERQNMAITVECLQELRQVYPHQKLLLFWDGAGWHRGSAVQNFIEADQHIQIVQFPPYSPEENPQEHLWKAGRAQITHNRFIQDIDRVADEFVDYLQHHYFSYSLLGFSAAV